MIYFIRVPIESDGDPAHVIKIGTTIRLSKRINQLKYEYGPDLTILGVLDGGHPEERSLHQRFGHLRITKELFAVEEDLLDFIASECREWDGIDEVPLSSLGVLVRIDHDLAAKAQFLASEKGLSLREYLDSILRPLIRREWKDAARRVEEGTPHERFPR